MSTTDLVLKVLIEAHGKPLSISGIRGIIKAKYGREVQDNTINRDIHDLRRGRCIPIASAFCADHTGKKKSYKEHWLEGSDIEGFKILNDCRKVLLHYPPEHSERAKIEVQIKQLENVLYRRYEK